MSRSLFFQIPVMVLLAGLLGIGVNYCSTDPLPLLADASQFALAVPEELKTDETQIRELWESGQVIFIDARASDEFQAGHIPGSFSLPYSDFEEGTPEMVASLPTDVTLVVYCDGADCQASHIIAEKLIENGYTEGRVKVYSGGWTVWEQAGGEVAVGDE